VVWKKVVMRRPEWGRGRENWPKIHVSRPYLSLYSGHRSNRPWVSAGSIKPTHVHRCRFDRFGRKPTLYNHEILFLLIVQIPSPVFNRRPEKGRRTRERERERERERGF
jgi:hypothetical protein